MLRGMTLGLALTVSTGLLNPAAAQGQASSGMMSEAIEYTIVFKSTWTAATHPFEYPAAGLITGNVITLR